MAEPASEDLRELERLLVIAADSGETRSVAGLQEELGMGRSDLMGALDVLREHGKAITVAPDEWSGPGVEDMPPESADAGPVRVSVSDDEDGGERAVEYFRRQDGQLEPLPDGEARRWHTIGAAGPTVRLTRAIADALDPEAIGKIVKAGLESADGDRFILEVTL